MSSERNISELHTTDRLPDYARGELPAEERAAVRAHLDVCAACREELVLVELLRSGSNSALEPAEAARLYTPLPSSSGRSWGVGVWRAAAGVVIVLGGYAIWLAGRSDPQVAASWSVDDALVDWDQDLAELRPGLLDLRVALGANGEPAAWPELEGEGMEGLDDPWGEIE